MAQPRERLSLDGVWGFATDIDSRGEYEKWFLPDAALPAMPRPGYAPEASGTIRVPGIWDNQGYGTPTDKVHHQFVGKGWYKRQIEVPGNWDKRRVFLVITGVHRYSKVWIDDHFLGENIGFLSVQEYDISQYVAPGRKAMLTIQVDSRQRWEVDAMYGACSLADYMDVAWGGIWGHVYLESRFDSWLADPFVRPNVSDSSCSAGAVLRGDAALADRIRLEVFDAAGRRVAATTDKLKSNRLAGEELTVKAAWPDPAFWTPETPNLYKARLSLLRGDELLDAVESRFGMRQFAIDGHRILLNGKPIMLRGHGDDHIYPEQMAMPSDKELFLARLRVAKSFGFNFVRNHSAMMPPEYYEACDEVGMIVTAEFPICYETHLPGTGCVWKANALPLTDPAVATETYYRQWRAAILRYRNHPSIMAWVRGNELYQPSPQRREFQRIARELDPDRFYIDSDSVAFEVLKPENDRDTVDFYTVPFAEDTNPLDNPAKYRTERPAKPIIVHEAGNYVAFSRPSLIDQFQHNFKPFWLAAGRAKLDALGLADEADRWAEKSERLYLLCHKFNNEAMRGNPYIIGYQWWLLQDYWTTSNGLVDHYFRPKSITAEEALKINNDVVLLQDGLDRTYRAGGPFELKLLASNYSPEPLGGTLSWAAKIDGGAIAQHRAPAPRMPQGEVVEVARVAIDLPTADAPRKLTLEVKLDSGVRSFANDWSAWIYPKEIRPNLRGAGVMADPSSMKMTLDWGLKPLPTDGALSHRAVYVVESLDARLIDAMDRGACVVLLGGEIPALPSRPITFRPSWWRGTAVNLNQFNHTGTFVYEHPATRAMAPDGWCDDGWLHLIEGSRRYLLEAAPVRPQVIVRALPTLEQVDDQALMFEVSVGRGSLIVNGMNHRRAAGRPENQWLLARLIERGAEFPRPAAKWPASFLHAQQREP